MTGSCCGVRIRLGKVQAALEGKQEAQRKNDSGASCNPCHKRTGHPALRCGSQPISRACCQPIFRFRDRLPLLWQAPKEPSAFSDRLRKPRCRTPLAHPVRSPARGRLFRRRRRVRMPLPPAATPLLRRSVPLQPHPRKVVRPQRVEMSPGRNRDGPSLSHCPLINRRSRKRLGWQASATSRGRGRGSSSSQAASSSPARGAVIRPREPWPLLR